MMDAVVSGIYYWNWGGTWLTQNGVYNFKKKWGTKDLRYFYYTIVLDRGILSLTKEELLAAYSHFYVIPFNVLGGSK
jgi:hypothetical protein